MLSNGITHISSFVKIGLLVQKMKGGTQTGDMVLSQA
jgi:hypothetical protein